MSSDNGDAPAYLLPSEVGRLMNPEAPISADGVKKYDDRLKPLRTATGVRLYERSGSNASSRSTRLRGAGDNLDEHALEEIVERAVRRVLDARQPPAPTTGEYLGPKAWGKARSVSERTVWRALAEGRSRAPSASGDSGGSQRGKGEIPGREPGIFPGIWHGQHIERVKVPPTGVAALSMSRRRQWLAWIAVQPA